MKDLDRRIKNDSTEQIYWDTRVDGDEITIEVRDGKVRMHGKVESRAAKSAAQQDIEIIPGVLSIENELDVVPKEKQDYPDDLTLNENARSILSFNNDLAALDIEVSVKQGWATLKGNVDSMWQKAKAEDLISDLVGVKGVTNKITIVPTDKVEDEVISKQIENALRRNTYIEAENIDVKVKGGIVTLSGYADRLVDSMSAYNTAFYIRGVKDVNNQIVIKKS